MIQVLQVDDDVKRKLTSLNLAIDGWEAAEAILRERARQELQPGGRLYDGMMVGACVLYGRPFKRAHGLVRLSELSRFDGLADATVLAEIHEAAVEARDMVLADQNLVVGVESAEGGESPPSPEETIVTVGDSGLTVESGGLCPPEDLHDLLPLLLKSQLARARSMRLQLMSAILPPLFSEPVQFKIVGG